VEWSGVEWSGVEWSGVEWSGYGKQAVMHQVDSSFLTQGWDAAQSRNPARNSAAWPTLLGSSSDSRTKATLRLKVMHLRRIIVTGKGFQHGCGG
jgi:hypothetical protein